MKADVRIIIVNFNGGLYLEHCIAALIQQTYTDFEVVVVDNASTDGSSNIILPDARFSWLKLKENVGFAAGNNRGAENTQAQWIVTLNPDAFAAPDWLEKLMLAAHNHPDVVMFGSTQLRESSPMILDGSGDHLFATGLAWRGNYGHPIKHLPSMIGESFCPCAAAAAYKTEVFFAAGGFDERFFCYYEDVDLGFRLRLMGGICLQIHDAIVHHVGSGITSGYGDFIRYHTARNRIWLFIKNMPDWLFLLLIIPHIFMNLALIIWAIKKGHARPVLRGIMDAVKSLPDVMIERQLIQANRKTSTYTIACALSWSTHKLLHNKHDIRTLSK